MNKKLPNLIPPSKSGVKKILRTLKLALIIIFLSVLQVSATVYSQRTFNPDVHDKSINDVLKTIEQQSQIRFFYSNDLAVMNDRINNKSENKNIINVLDDIFTGSPLTYKTYENNPILIAPGELLQQHNVTGKIVNSKNEPLPGVAVLVKGTTLGTLTDVLGNFTVNNLYKGSVLVVSFIGMQPQEIVVGSNTSVNVTLIEENINLDEVIDIGYGTQKKRDISTAISSVSKESLKDKPVSTFSQAIAGQMAGVRISNTNNQPGGGTSITIRGVNSINASIDPLIVIDGFPQKDLGFSMYQNPLSTINPKDIESIEVLKDASSSAIYGAQAANGVILITTKRGKSGKPSISINVSTGYEQMSRRINVLNRADFLQYMDDSRAQAYIMEDPNFGADNPNAPLWKWTDDNATRISNWTNYSSNRLPMHNQAPDNLYNRWITVTDETKAQPFDTDWQNVATHVGKVHDINLSMSGGTYKVKYMVSGGYYNQEGIEQAVGYKRFSFRANVDLKINNWMKAGIMIAPTLESNDLASNLENSNYNIIVLPPILGPYTATGTPTYLGYSATQIIWSEWNLGYFVNPLVRYMVQDNRRTARSNQTIFGEINFTKDLKFRSEFHTEFRNLDRNFFLPATFPTTGAPTSRPQDTYESNNTRYWNSQNLLTYAHIFDKHSINAIVGYSAEEFQYREFSDATRTRSSSTMIGSFARAMYNYNDIYYFTASVRRDGSSKFVSGEKCGIFPSFSAAWRVSEETFFSPLKKYINDIKIRAGYGVAGNSGISNFFAIPTPGTGSAVSPGYSNSNIGWESTADRGIGTDIEFLKNHISLSVDYYYRLTTNMLFSLPLPVITDLISVMQNIGSMRNRGFEYQITTRNFISEFKWTTSINLSYNRNKVLNTGKDKRPIISGSYSYTVEGRPMACIYAFDYLGPYQNWEDVKTNPIVNPTNPLWKYRSYPGSTKLFDINGDGVINSSDMTVIGDPAPDFIWGMNNTFEYKGFDLSIAMNGVMGGDRLLTNYNGFMNIGSGQNNVTTQYYNNYWTPDRTNALYTAPNRKSWDGTPNIGALLYKGTYINIQNISLGYTIPKSILQRLNISQARVYTNIQNALLITKYPGYNPEVNSQGNSALSQGVDAGAYPITRIVSFGINVTL